MAKLGSCFLIVRNGASIKQVNGASGLPITRIETISNCVVDRNKFGYADIYDAGKYEEFLLRDQDILMSHINSEKHLGKVAIYHQNNDEKIIHGMNLLMLRANPEIVFPQYIAYYFESPFFKRQIVSITKKSVNQASFTVTALKELTVPIVSLDKQRKIAAVLDKVSELIAKRRAQLDKLDLLVKAKFVEMFGDIHNSTDFPYLPIKDFANVVSGGTPDRNSPQYWDNGTIKWVKTTELQNGIIEDTEEKITKQGLENSSAKIVPADTILIAMYGQGKTRGMTGYLAVEAATNQACACILPSSKINQKYLWYYMIMSYEKLRSLAKGGNQPNLNGAMIKSFLVLMPPKELQDLFVTFVEYTEKSKNRINNSLQKLEMLKKALMQEYFR